jgi:hypothetical protein
VAASHGRAGIEAWNASNGSALVIVKPPSRRPQHPRALGQRAPAVRDRRLSDPREDAGLFM